VTARSRARTTVALALATVLALSAALLGGCAVPEETSNAQAAAPVHDKLSWVVLVDLSKSTESDREFYTAAYRDIVDAVGYGDSFVVYDIGQNSVVKGRKLVDEAIMEAEEPNEEIDEIAAEAQRKVWEKKHPIADVRAPLMDEAVLSDIEQTVIRGGSDIFGALKLAQRQFALTEASPRLVIMSDMIAKNEQIKMDSREFVSGDFDDAAWLAAHNGSDYIPSLDGAKVLVVGAGGSNEKHAENIRAFWMAYFPETGASLDEDAYGRQLPKAALTAFVE
jgi:hypothetical protein